MRSMMGGQGLTRLQTILIISIVIPLAILAASSVGIFYYLRKKKQEELKKKKTAIQFSFGIGEHQTSFSDSESSQMKLGFHIYNNLRKKRSKYLQDDLQSIPEVDSYKYNSNVMSMQTKKDIFKFSTKLSNAPDGKA